MTDKELLERIVVDPEVVVGKPVILGTRLTVPFILGLLAHGASVEEILREYEGLKAEDVQAFLLFAREALENTSFVALSGAA